MHIEHSEDYILLSNKSDNFDHFLSIFEEKHAEFEEKHLILQLSESLNITEEDLFVFLKYAEKHQQNGTSFVVVKEEVDIDKFPEWFNITPTLLEARDVLEMEEIQRDLGF